MKKYQHKTKVGQPVTKIEINIRAEKDKYNQTSLNKDGLFIIKYKIVHQTHRKIALSDCYITTLDRKDIDYKSTKWNNGHYTHIEDLKVNVITREDFFANGVFGWVYTIGDEDKAIKKLTKAMQNKVQRDYGFMFNLDVSDIVEKYLNKNNV